MTLSAAPGALPDPATLAEAGERALARFPGADDVAAAAGCVLVRAGRYAQAAPLLQRGSAAFGLQYIAAERLCLAMAERQQGRHTEARSDLE